MWPDKVRKPVMEIMELHDRACFRSGTGLNEFRPCKGAPVTGALQAAIATVSKRRRDAPFYISPIMSPQTLSFRNFKYWVRFREVAQQPVSVPDKGDVSGKGAPVRQCHQVAEGVFRDQLVQPFPVGFPESFRNVHSARGLNDLPLLLYSRPGEVVCWSM